MTKYLLSRGFILALLTLCVVGPSNFIHALSSGPPAGYSGAPGENNCTICHADYPLNSGTAQFTVVAPQIVASGATYPVNVGFTGSASVKHGFQITPRDGSGSGSGNWTVVLTNQTKNAFGSTVHHEHTTLGNTLSSWTMNWTAPPALPNGPVTFYAAGNQTNSSLTPSGDYVYATSAKMFQMSLATGSSNWPIGTSQTLTLTAPVSHAGEIYFIVPSANPTPVSFGDPFVLEVTPDWDFLFFALATPQIFQNINATLDAAGQATATINIPFEPIIIGIPLHFAGITADTLLNPTEVSNRTSIVFQ